MIGAMPNAMSSNTVCLDCTPIQRAENSRDQTRLSRSLLLIAKAQIATEKCDTQASREACKEQPQG
jgi:hypothetical protein